jgi:hypothetical protein
MSSATSTIEIYKSSKLLKDKNFVLYGSSAESIMFHHILEL